MKCQQNYFACYKWVLKIYQKIACQLSMLRIEFSLNFAIHCNKAKKIVPKMCIIEYAQCHIQPRIKKS